MLDVITYRICAPSVSRRMFLSFCIIATTFPFSLLFSPPLNFLPHPNLNLKHIKTNPPAGPALAPGPVSETQARCPNAPSHPSSPDSSASHHPGAVAEARKWIGGKDWCYRWGWGQEGWERDVRREECCARRGWCLWVEAGAFEVEEEGM